MPRVSVHVITYNHVAFIRRALEGVVAQQLDVPWEVIVADDASTDGTADIVREFAERHPGLIRPVLRSRNVGMMENYVDVLRRCRGTYVAFLDGDDRWTDPHKLQDQFDQMEADRSITISHHAVVVERIVDDADATGVEIIDQSTDDVGRPWHIGVMAIYPCSAMVRRSMVPDLDAEFLRLPGADYGLRVLALERGGTVATVPGRRAVRVVHSGGVWVRRDPDRQRRDVMAMHRYLARRTSGPRRAAIVADLLGAQRLDVSRAARGGSFPAFVGACRDLLRDSVLDGSRGVASAIEQCARSSVVMVALTLRRASRTARRSVVAPR